MSDDQVLIPPPPVLREKLARNLREARILRGLLRLSIKAAENDNRESPPSPQLQGHRSGVAR